MASPYVSEMYDPERFSNRRLNNKDTGNINGGAYRSAEYTRKNPQEYRSAKVMPPFSDGEEEEYQDRNSRVRAKIKRPRKRSSSSRSHSRSYSNSNGNNDPNKRSSRSSENTLARHPYTSQKPERESNERQHQSQSQSQQRSRHSDYESENEDTDGERSDYERDTEGIDAPWQTYKDYNLRERGGVKQQRSPFPHKMDATWMPGGVNPRFHRSVNDNRRPDTKNGPIFAAPSKIVGSGSMSYDETLFQTPYEDTANKISIGTMNNPYTGEKYEAFIDDVMPPNTDKAIPRYQLEQISPKLLHLQGGVNPHKPYRRRKEVCQEVYPDGGANPWGTQAYAAEIRNRLEEYAEADIWHNRDGTYPAERSMNGERPKDYFGLVPRHRPRPYLPPTQRNSTTTLGRMPTHEVLQNDLSRREMYAGAHQTKRGPDSGMDLPGAREGFGIGPINGVPESWVTGEHENVHARLLPAEFSRGYGMDGTQTYHQGATIIDPDSLRDTLKSQMEREFAMGGVTVEVPDGIVIQDTELRDTLKSQMERPFAVMNANLESVGGVNIQDSELRATLKSQTEREHAIAQPQLQSAGDYVVGEYDNLETHRTFTGQNAPTAGADALMNFGDQLGPGLVQSQQYRGQTNTDWVPYSKIPASMGTGGTQTEFVKFHGESDRLGRENLEWARPGLTDKTAYVSRRYIPEVRPSQKRLDCADGQDYQYRVRGNYWGQLP